MNQHREFYEISYADLVRKIGEKEALEKVNMYQCSTHFKDLEVVKNSLLLQSYQQAGTSDTGRLANTKFSVFYDVVNGKQLGILNTKVKKDLSLTKVVELIKSEVFKTRTEKLRNIPRVSNEMKKKNKEYKKFHFCYACFSGTFSSRKDKNLIEHSRLICIDLDHLEHPREAIKVLSEKADNEHFVLCFISPNGDGVKVLYYADDLSPETQKDYYIAFSEYSVELCGLPSQAIDIGCKDPSRACFLPYDPDIITNPKFI